MVSDKPLVSVGLCTFKKSDYLRKSLQSLLDQSYPNLEIIVSQDRSDVDQIEQIVLSIASRDQRVQFFRQPTQLFMNGNFQFTLSRATGKYFFWAADDDLWDPTFVEELVNVLEKDKSLIHASSDALLIDEDDRVVGEMTYDFDYSSFEQFSRFKKFIGNLLLTNYPFYGLYRREELVRHKILNYIGSDQAFYGSIIISGRSQLVRKPLFFYRQSGNSETAEKYIKALGISNNRFNLYLFPFRFFWTIVICPFNAHGINLSNRIYYAFYATAKILGKRSNRIWLWKQFKQYLVN